MAPGAPLIQFRLDPRSGVPAYRQLVDQVAQAIRLGLVGAGDQLPSVREVVRQISINPNTVHRAYREMETQGLVEGRPGLGTFVTASTSSSTSPQRQAALLKELEQWLKGARRAGLDDDDIRDLLSTALRGDEDEPKETR